MAKNSCIYIYGIKYIYIILLINTRCAVHHMVGIYYSAQDVSRALYLQLSLLEKKEETRAKGPLDCMTVTSLNLLPTI